DIEKHDRAISNFDDEVVQATRELANALPEHVYFDCDEAELEGDTEVKYMLASAAWARCRTETKEKGGICGGALLQLLMVAQCKAMQHAVMPQKNLMTTMWAPCGKPPQ
ncbi:unnamed protein product, partial [Prorocentrum cordatum]